MYRTRSESCSSADTDDIGPWKAFRAPPARTKKSRVSIREYIGNPPVVIRRKNAGTESTLKKTKPVDGTTATPTTTSSTKVSYGSQAKEGKEKVGTSKLAASSRSKQSPAGTSKQAPTAAVTKSSKGRLSLTSSAPSSRTGQKGVHSTPSAKPNESTPMSAKSPDKLGDTGKLKPNQRLSSAAYRPITSDGTSRKGGFEQPTVATSKQPPARPSKQTPVSSSKKTSFSGETQAPSRSVTKPKPATTPRRTVTRPPAKYPSYDGLSDGSDDVGPWKAFAQLLRPSEPPRKPRQSIREYINSPPVRLRKDGEGTKAKHGSTSRESTAVKGNKPPFRLGTKSVQIGDSKDRQKYAGVKKKTTLDSKVIKSKSKLAAEVKANKTLAASVVGQVDSCGDGQWAKARDSSSKTEYMTHFQPFTASLDMSHVYLQPLTSRSDSNMIEHDWTDELRELRERAAIYRERENASHFSCGASLQLASDEGPMDGNRESRESPAHHHTTSLFGTQSKPSSGQRKVKCYKRSHSCPAVRHI